MYIKKNKYYTVADFAIRLRVIHEVTTRAYEDKVIKEIKEKNNYVDSLRYLISNKIKKRQIRAEAHTIPLTVFLLKEGTVKG